MNTDFFLAYDRAGSVRLIDEDGRLRVAVTPISKAAVNRYFGREIPGAQALGLAPDRSYRLLRAPDELEKAADSFNSIPVLAEHVHVTAQTPRPDLVVGATGTDARFTDPYLTNALVLWNAQAIEGVRSGEQRELSCAYRYVPVMEPGVWQGQPYDGRMTQIRGNHVALVRAGRAGPDVLVADAQPKEHGMAFSPSRGLSRPGAGADLSGAGRTGPLQSGVAGKHPGQDEAGATPAGASAGGGQASGPAASGVVARADPQGAGGCTAADLFARLGAALASGGLDMAAGPQALAAWLAPFLAGKAQSLHPVATDTQQTATPGTAQQDTEQGSGPGMAQDSAVRRAVDAALMAERQRQRDVSAALALVRPLVGDVLGMDSAEDILRYALRECGVQTEGVNMAGLRALVAGRAGMGGLGDGSVGAQDGASSGDFTARYGLRAPRKF
ncbi:DUF2213 domain-containing protein [Acetobacter suratthaniensis]|uniref:DUF2213 domain-containing protein n=1 Tax=Acetobacter suratthaniensis TaxID=1502841 RepID=A0ABS3LPG2_9PROT|nr:DUF2213 domain-containing protein [Acetobacter suratthaniensis]MBO1329254.1 DUF2213 domain-containing protein [Acetobacter suratthaniensis]MCX2567300.1 DUF2213 domain-containing protein [Acetobacter suratthaniensis]